MKGKRVAIVGLADRDPPWGDKTWSVWALAWDPMAHRADRTFEMHDDWRKDGPAHQERLLTVPDLYMQSKEAEIPGSTAYPQGAVDLAGGYIESSVAYMVALALYEGASEIALHGVEMAADSEYAYQKPNMEYLLGLARGRGVKVTLPPGCALLRPSSSFNYDGRYGHKA